MATTARAGKKRTARIPQKSKAHAPAKREESVQEGGAVLLSISQAAAEFGRDRATVAKRIAEMGIVSAETRRGYPVYRLRDLIEIERRAPDGETDPEKLSVYDRGLYFKAELDRMKVDVERGSLMRREDVEAEWARVLKIIAQEMDTLPDEIERDIGASPLILEKIETKIDEVRERMYAGVVSVGEVAEGGDVPAAIR